ncbi:MAG: 2,3-bisphosphoglycerate-independent phosphoglycerate mutase [Candidatus Shapirobacteria bacterium]
MLIIMDGWGIAPASPGNAVTLAKTPNFNRFWAVYPHTQILAAGEAVGLPRGEEGNSETGHLNLGAGGVVFQDLLRIDMAIAGGSFFKILAFQVAIEHVQKNNSKLHLLGLLGAGGVHSSLPHLIALIQLAKQAGVKKLFLHLFTDGRDSPPTSAPIYLTQVDNELKKLSLGKIATLCGRYYAMDRDYHWERTEKAYNLLCLGQGQKFFGAVEAVKASYSANITDEFLEPTLLDKNGLIEDNDAAIFFNFRIDRPRQLTKALVLNDLASAVNTQPVFDPYAEKYGQHLNRLITPNRPFKRQKVLKNFYLTTMTEYEHGLPVAAAFPPELVKMPLARLLAENNLRQLRLAETEKERFVTYYFDGQRERAFPGEERVILQSPNVATYDLQPEMAAVAITDELIKRLYSGLYQFVVVNYANPDMVGHTGVIPAAIKAVETVDKMIGPVVKVVSNLGGASILTADHGNCEEMLDPATKAINTEHSNNPVPFVLVDPKMIGQKTLRLGVLADVAPTILEIMGIAKPEMMTGRNLLN